MKDMVRRAYLLDYYGALLTDKQRDIYEWYYQQDMSLGEISEIANVSRNAVHDLINRTDEKLERLESALGLIASGEEQKRNVEALVQCFEGWLEANGSKLGDGAREELAALIRRIRP